MKIVQVQTQAEAAGAQRVSDMVGAGLRSQGHDVRTVFMYRKTAAYDHDPFAHFILDYAPRGPLDLARAITGLIGYMRRTRPDAVISYQHYGNIFGTLAGRLAGAKRLIANQSGAPGKHGGRFALIADKLLGASGCYHYSVVNSAWMERQFADFPKSYQARVRRIDHGVARPPAATLDKHAARRFFGLPDSAFVAVSSGRLTADKNQAALVAVLARIPELHLALAGVGPEQQSLVAMAEVLGVRQRLHLIGELPALQIFDFLAAGDVFLFASRTETFGLSVAEAAIAGLPIVTNDLPVLRDVLGAAADYVDVDDTDTFAAVITKLRTEPDLLSRMREAGSALAARYAAETMCRSYEALLA